MSTPSPLDPKESTEAKLCAYLEGELDPAERQEIERHLDANPQHRQLLADLARTREWVRSIPAENLPSEFADNFAAQVERSMLLDESRERQSGLMMRWPQYAVIAAILLMMLGLGVVLVEMLKGPRPGEKSIVMATPSTPMAEDRDRPGSARGVDLTPPLAAAMDATTTAPVVVLRANGASPENTVAKAMLAAPQVNNSEQAVIDSIKSRLTIAGYRLPVDQPAVCFTVTTDSPDASAQQLRGFFDRHQLVYENPLPGQHQTSPSIQPTGQHPATQPATTAPSGEGIYAARHLTALQLELLSASLSADNVNQSVLRSALIEGGNSPPPGALVKGQTLTITVAQLVGPGIDKTNVVKIADDGSIALPMIDPVPAAGQPAAELQQRIADKYREANLIPQATVTVSTTAATPSTRATVTTQPITTQPAIASTEPVERVSGTNVIVVIQKTTAALPR